MDRWTRQREDNLAALDVRLAPQPMEELNAVSKPSLGFPADFLRNVGSFGYGDTAINGETFPANAGAPTADSQRY